MQDIILLDGTQKLSSWVDFGLQPQQIEQHWDVSFFPTLSTHAWTHFCYKVHSKIKYSQIKIRIELWKCP